MQADEVYFTCNAHFSASASMIMKSKSARRPLKRLYIIQKQVQCFFLILRKIKIKFVHQVIF